VGYVKNDLQTVNGRRKSGDYEASGSLFENFLDGGYHIAFRGRSAGHRSVRRIAQHGHHAFVTVSP
jgi:hypothetical protein